MRPDVPQQRLAQSSPTGKCLLHWISLERKYFSTIIFISLVSAPVPIYQPNIADFIFVNGSWYNRFHQYGMWYGPFQHSMTFNPYNNMIEGYGVDNVGKFVLSGSYSRDTLQITIVQLYQVRN